MHGDFTWIDLSTFDVEAAKTFYHKVFSWDTEDDPSGYTYCLLSGQTCAAIFEMPTFFQKIKMPSFWMTYVEVDDMETTINFARAKGGKVEFEESNPVGKVALIRDPLGAGFTCYEGMEKTVREYSNTHGRWVWSELFISDLEKVKKFYQSLFNCEIKKDSSHADRYILSNKESYEIGAIQVADNDVKGDKEFWGVFFRVSDVETVIKRIEKGGGVVHSEEEWSNSQGRHIVASDPQGATFFLTERSSEKRQPNSKKKTQKPQRQIRSGVASPDFFSFTWLFW